MRQSGRAFKSAAQDDKKEQKIRAGDLVWSPSAVVTRKEGAWSNSKSLQALALEFRSNISSVAVKRGVREVVVVGTT
jgi:hypothetical protein